jgi:hypothetical protein
LIEQLCRCDASEGDGLTGLIERHCMVEVMHAMRRWRRGMDTARKQMPKRA